MDTRVNYIKLGGNRLQVCIQHILKISNNNNTWSFTPWKSLSATQDTCPYLNNSNIDISGLYMKSLTKQWSKQTRKTSYLSRYLLHFKKKKYRLLLALYISMKIIITAFTADIARSIVPVLSGYLHNITAFFTSGIY